MKRDAAKSLQKTISTKRAKMTAATSSKVPATESLALAKHVQDRVDASAKRAQKTSNRAAKRQTDASMNTTANKHSSVPATGESMSTGEPPMSARSLR
jgi:hypothetical protein